MILLIKTEYDTIFLYAKKLLNIELVQNEIKKIEKDFKYWEENKNQFLKDNYINLKDHKYKLENIYYEINKYGHQNKFVNKRFMDIQAVDIKINEYNHLNPHPKFSIKERLENLGLEELNDTHSDITINLSLEKNTIESNI